MAIADGRPSLLICLPTALDLCKPDIASWLAMTGFEIGQRGLVSKLCVYTLRSSRILCNRNMFVEEAIRGDYDYVLMVDPDMRPDLYCRPEIGEGITVLPTARPFLSVALEFFRSNPFAVLGAPACCDPPKRLVNVFRCKDGKSSRITHEEAHAAVLEPNPAVEQVAAIGTGLIMFPTRILPALKKPYFDDEFSTEDKTSPSRTQDIYFTENCSLSGIPVFCAWMCWAGHHKDVVLGCPGIDGQWMPEKKFVTFGGPSSDWGTAAAKEMICPTWGELATRACVDGTFPKNGVGVEIGPDASWQPPVTLAASNGTP